MKKTWKVIAKINDKIIKKYPEYNQVVLQLLFNRGIIEDRGSRENELEKIDEFLNPNYEKFNDPFLFQNMEKAVELIIKNIKNGNKICVYGDYDADGVTASALLSQTLNILKAKVNVYIPNRVSEGYGLNKEAIDKIIKDEVKLLITVDNGIRNKKEVEYIKEKGINVLITDHHPTDEENEDIPDCLIINSALKREKYPCKFLAGVGVAFKLAKALIKKSTLNIEEKLKLEERMLDLVAIGTIADLVSLLGENRILVKKGLESINKTKRLGLKELIKIANINKKIDSWNIGFQIGPRLNAAGRMDHANIAYQLLITNDQDEAKILANGLNNKNIERQKVTKEIFDEVESSFAKDFKNIKTEFILIKICKNEKAWNEGVVGLVAGRIMEKYYRPCLIITKIDGGYKGSGRSVKGFNLATAVEECKDLLTKYGGHPMACGFSLKKDNIDKFIKKIKKIAKKELKEKNLKSILKIEYEVEIRDISKDLVGDIEKFAPFGQHNQKPRLISRKIRIINIEKLGIKQQHIKFKFENMIFGIAFGRADEWKEFKIDDIVDIVYYIEINYFNGRSDLQLKLIDIKISA